MKYLLWAVLLILQNASFTMTSRARNSGSDWYHAFAAVFSNGFWILNMMFLFDPTRGLLQSAETLTSKSVFVVIYIVCTVFGSVIMGKFLREKFETGKRRVGYYEGKEMEKKQEAVKRQFRYDPVSERAVPVKSTLTPSSETDRGWGDRYESGGRQREIL